MSVSRREPGYDISVSIKQADIQIGAVEVKDATTDNRLEVDTFGRSAAFLKPLAIKTGEFVVSKDSAASVTLSLTAKHKIVVLVTCRESYSGRPLPATIVQINLLAYMDRCTIERPFATHVYASFDYAGSDSILKIYAKNYHLGVDLAVRYKVIVW